MVLAVRTASFKENIYISCVNDIPLSCLSRSHNELVPRYLFGNSCRESSSMPATVPHIRETSAQRCLPRTGRTQLQEQPSSLPLNNS